MTVACASAPGKVILFGEHAVVYGEPAVAAALSDLRVHVKVTCVSTGRLCMSMPDLPTKVDFEIDSKSVLELHDLRTPPTPDCAEQIAQVILENDASLDDLSISTITSLIYLVRLLIPSPQLSSGLEIQVISRGLPVGAGLGSSAAFGVAVAASLVKVSSQSNQIGRPDPEHLKRIDEYAFYSEVLLHGTPSGIDNGKRLFSSNVVCAFYFF
jgi:mevalonate kinase